MGVRDVIAVSIIAFTGAAILGAVGYLAWSEFGLYGLAGFGWVLALGWSTAHFGVLDKPMPPELQKDKGEVR